MKTVTTTLCEECHEETAGSEHLVIKTERIRVVKLPWTQKDGVLEERTLVKGRVHLYHLVNRPQRFDYDPMGTR